MKTPLLQASLIALLAGTAGAQVAIFSNGSTDPATPALATGTTTSGGAAAPAGFQWSEIQGLSPTEANAVAGFSTHVFGGGAYRFADDFTVPAGRVWRLDSLSLFAYQTNAALPPGTSPFAGVSVRIWSGVPGEADSQVVFGDDATNRMTSSLATNILRVFNNTVLPLGGPADSTRLIWKSDAGLGSTSLTAGTYWIDWQYTTADPSGVAFSPPVTKAGQRTQAGWNARQLKSSGWTAVVDAGKPDSAADVAQDLPFVLLGADTCASDFNFDGFVDPDDLSDFITCFFLDVQFPGTCPQADFNADGFRDPDDLSDFITAFFTAC